MEPKRSEIARVRAPGLHTLLCMSRRTSVYLIDELDEAVRASGKSLPDLIRLGLAQHQAARVRRGHAGQAAAGPGLPDRPARLPDPSA